MTKALYPLTADPITLGHLEIIKKAVNIFDKVVLAISDITYKKTCFTLKERENLAKIAIKNSLSKKQLEKVEIKTYTVSTSGFVIQNDIDVVVRGIRDNTDYTSESRFYELLQSQLNGITFLTIFCDSSNTQISSQNSKTLCKAGILTNNFLPLSSKQALEQRLNNQFLVGVTGLSQTGKSHLCHEAVRLSNQNIIELAIHHIDLDEVCNEIYNSTNFVKTKYILANAVSNHSIINKDNTMNKFELKKAIQNNPNYIQKLNQTMHPAIFSQMQDKLIGKSGVILVEGALIAECNWVKYFNNNMILVNNLPKKEVWINKFQFSTQQKKELIQRKIQATGWGKLWQVDDRTNIINLLKEIQNNTNKII